MLNLISNHIHILNVALRSFELINVRAILGFLKVVLDIVVLSSVGNTKNLWSLVSRVLENICICLEL